MEDWTDHLGQGAVDDARLPLDAQLPLDAELPVERRRHDDPGVTMQIRAQAAV